MSMNENIENTIPSCTECGQVEVPLYTVTVDGEERKVCADCLERLGFAVCHDCGQVVPLDDTVEIDAGWGYSGGRWHRLHFRVCADCADENYVRCDSCGEYFDPDRNGLHDNWGTNICPSCEDSYRVCSDCGRIIHEDYAWYDDDTDEYYCEDCWSNRTPKYINSYGYKPYPIFGTTHGNVTTYEDSDLTFGVELEIDDGNDIRGCSVALHDLTDMLYQKHDGSLDDGIEIVTHPGTLAYHMTEFPWEDVCSTSLRYGFRSHEAGTCGLHIHVGRKQLGNTDSERKATVGKVVLLVDRLWNYIARFSRRGGDFHWAERPGLEYILSDSGMTGARLIDRVLRHEDDAGRYRAVNLQNSSTIEFRFNRGTLRKDTILASIQMASNLCLYAKNHALEDVLGATWDDIQHVNEYDELNSYCSARFEGQDFGTLPEAYKLRNPNDPVTPDPDAALKVGDIVSVDGKMATVISAEDESMPLLWFHAYCGYHDATFSALPEDAHGHCYWVSRGRIGLVARANEVRPGDGIIGQLVMQCERGSDMECYNDWREDLRNRIGVVIDGGRSLANVKWFGFSGGHSCGGLLTGEDYRSGWNFRTNDLVYLGTYEDGTPASLDF